MIKKVASIGLIAIFSLTIVFHLLILLKVVPYDMVWGGKLNNDADMYRFELVSLALNLLFLLVVLAKARVIKTPVSERILNIILWVMIALFALNTVGNLLSENQFEKIAFTPMTILIAVLCGVLLRK